MRERSLPFHLGCAVNGGDSIASSGARLHARVAAVAAVAAVAGVSERSFVGAANGIPVRLERSVFGAPRRGDDWPLPGGFPRISAFRERPPSVPSNSVTQIPRRSLAKWPSEDPISHSPFLARPISDQVAIFEAHPLPFFVQLGGHSCLSLVASFAAASHRVPAPRAFSF